MFEELWQRYPKKLGKKAAIKHYKATVKNKEDELRINKALDNYIRYIHNKNTEFDYIMYGSTFFYNWEDWESYTEPMRKAKEEVLQDENDKKWEQWQKDVDNVSEHR